MAKTNTKINWPLVGNKHITEFLSKSILKRQLFGTYIFDGPDNLGKTTLANFFAKSILCQEYANEKEASLPCGQCNSCTSFPQKPKDKEVSDSPVATHGDFHIVKKSKDKKNIAVEEIREFIRMLGLSSFLGQHKIGIIKHADSLSLEAANALLKTLEEPKDNVIIILIVQSLDALPKTILSRSQVLHFRPIRADEIYDYLISQYQANRSAAKNLSRLCLGRPALAVKFFENKEFLDNYTKQGKVFLDFFQSDINSRILKVEELIGKKPQGQEAVIIANRILEVWSGVLRDWLLYEYGHTNMIQHQMFLDEIANQKGRISVKKILSVSQAIKDSREYLFSNVNPKLVLENVAISV